MFTTINRSPSVNFYADEHKKFKRNCHYEEKKRKGVCGVVNSKEKPWFCGEISNACQLCNSFYIKNINSQKN